jgi:tetratricopeptide (TPR) repeat protein
VKGYAAKDVAKLLGLSPTQVRAFARSGFLRPERGSRGEFTFSFPDLVLLRAAKGLAEARIPLRRITAALRRLRQQLPAGRPLSAVRIIAEGDRIVVHDGATAWNPESGQLVLDFAVSELASRVAPLARRAAQAARDAEDEMGADEWYDLGFDLEAVDVAEARDAYRRALELDPHHADAHVNLGRLLQEGGEAAQAASHYLLALEVRPRDATAPDARRTPRDTSDAPPARSRPHTSATAWFNLGIALEDLKKRSDAIKAYERAISIEPTLADAWFNLSRLYEAAGKRAAALRSLSKYRLLARHRAT